MKKASRILVPLLLVIFIIASIWWYLFEYDPQFTRDMLLHEARYFTSTGNTRLSSFFYGLAYRYSDQDDSVAIELANQYKTDGNYTKAEYTLTNAIADGASVSLITELCKTYVEQDKLLDAVTMLNRISDPVIKAQIDKLRPEAPAADAASGFYTQYISVSLTCPEGALYYTVNGEYPSTDDPVFSEPITLEQGETIIQALSVGTDGLVSPLTTVRYTVGGVIEPITFDDPAFDAAIRQIIGLDADDVVYSNVLWDIKEFTFPDDAKQFTDLTHLPYLESLTIENKTIDSLVFLSSLSYLTEVNFTGCRIAADDLTYLAALPALENLTLTNCGLSTIANLSSSQTLRYLDLSNNTLRNLEPLSNMFTLRELHLDHNAVTNPEALSTLTQLEVLDLSFNSLTTISPLTTCIGLRSLNVSNNQLIALTGIDALTDLTTLSAASNAITDVSIVAACTDLTTLDISTNQLTDISALSSLGALESFDFSYNQIEKLPEWGDGCALRTVSGSHNLLKNIDILGKMEDLSYVYMDYNDIESIDALANCYHLVLVNVYANPIEDVSALTAHNIIVNYDPTK